MCDVCGEFLELLQTYQERVSSDGSERPTLTKEEVEVVSAYVQAWPQRQCMCGFQVPKNFERFHLVLQNIICIAVYQLKEIKIEGKRKYEEEKKEIAKTEVPAAESSAEPEPSKDKSAKSAKDKKSKKEESWSLEERAGLFNLLAKMFAQNFPMYTAYKLSGQPKLEEMSQQELANLGSFCEIHDAETPVFLLRYVCFFFKSGGIFAMADCFEEHTVLPVILSQAIIAIVCNLKMWLNYRSVLQLFVPLRSRVLRYLCNLSDKDLRLPGVKTMADFMWSSVKDPLDAPLTFDRDGLDLAFKYFSSSTLTMRLAGVAHINAHINMFNELCNNDSVAEVESVGQSLANWLVDNNIIAHIFGPNLHVEVIKQSHVVLSFLAMEGKISNEHIDIMWAAAQLKHCSRQVHDLLPPLIKHLEARPVLHLYSLLCKLEPRDHTEQSLYLASALIKFIWSSSGAGGMYGALAGDPALMGGLGKVGGLGPMAPRRHAVSGANTSSENSVSMDGSNSDDEQVGSETDSSQHSEDPRKTPSTGSEGPSPRKQPRKVGPVAGRLRAACLPTEDSSDPEDLMVKVGGRSRDLREAGDRPVSRRGHKTAGGRGSESALSDPDIKVDENTPKQQRRIRIGKHKKVAKPSPAGSKSSGVKIRECGEDGSESDEESPSLQRVTSPDKRKIKKKSGLVLRQGNTEFIQMLGEEEEEEEEEDDDDHSQSSYESPKGGAAVLTELASLVQGPPEHDCRTFPVPTFQVQRAVRRAREMIEDMSGEEEGSYSSRMSNKSEKNMADFDGEESGCEDELAQLAAQAQHYGNMAAAFHSRFHPARPSLLLEASRVFAQFSLDAVCRPGNTLLWDLLQDDKICQLGEGLALEAEKALCNLLCYNTERTIRMKFIEGCLENVANDRSVVISLRMLPKLFGSFQQFRGTDTHQVTMWAEHEHHMMAHFFSNLVSYVSHGPRNPILHPHHIEVQVRFSFLTSIYSSTGTPDSFRLSLEQVDTLWACLAGDGQCSDELASWLLTQARSTGGQGALEWHALSYEALRHLYLHKLPSLRPESISAIALGLFQTLCNLARVAASHPQSPLRGVDSVGVDHLWKIALRANNTDVSMAAIQYLNGFYVSRQLEQEGEFVSQCMAHLAAATSDLATAEDPSLLCIQRALLLLRTHLDTFRRRYAYHLRRWALEGKGVGSHVALIAERSPMRVIVQPAGSSDKVTLELQASDLVAELRAEVAAFWEALQAQTLPSAAPTSPQATQVLGSEGPIRMITQGQELTTDFDEKTLHEMGFKDQQLVFISMGASRPVKKRDSLDTPSVLPPPPRESLPTLLLLQPKYFEQLFSLMHTLSAMKTTDRLGHQLLHTKAQVLSRRVWDILTLLPTSPTLFEGFQALGSGPVENSTLQTLLDPASPQKLMYSLYIVESLSRFQPPRRMLRKAEGDESVKIAEPTWSQQFTRHGGLRHLFDIFMSGVLQRLSGGDGSEWQQDCLATLLKLLCQLGVNIAPLLEEAEPIAETSEGGGEVVARRKKRAGARAPHFSDRLIILRLNEAMLQMMDVKTAMPRLTSILYEASLPRDPNHYKTGFWGRAQVVHYAMALLVSWVHSSEVVREALFSAPNFSTWLQRLVLEDPEPSVRREVCSALYRLCLCSSSRSASHSPSQLAAPMLAKLLEFLPIAEGMRPQRQEHHHVADDGKEPYGPACRDYFWLLCQLVDSLTEDLIKESVEDPQGCVLDIEGLAKRLCNAVVSREYLEARHNLVEDEGLIGLLSLTCTVLKHNPPFKTRQEGQDFMLQVFDFLFALPNPRQRLLPKCKSHAARSAAYDLLVELSKCAPENYRFLHEKLLTQHQPNQETPYPWDYWPHDDGRSDCGYVGLTNLGATCYMASCMQHLYMMPQARAAILQAQCDSSSKHEHTLKEMQRMFAYLLESERKAYNPRSFCKVYQMDHQPLNTGEQKDMAEFFIDLVSKLEEMTPELKQLVKKLFCGTLSNNFVSLDCDHVSRNLEEFYTVRCQVADMRNLYDSLDEVTVKDTLEGDNMYTCSQCGKKVRAEKRACFKKLPRILCFNTMRYTFNMVTMLKEKVNTHFSFPLRLDMSGYVEKHLMPQHYQEEKLKSQQHKKGDQADEQTASSSSEPSADSSAPVQDKDEPTTSTSEQASTPAAGPATSEASEDLKEYYEYDLIGVTVHTGTADGGHYYSFIRDRTTTNRDKWFLFNDAEVKPFDPSQIAAECFGGEMTSKTYDSVNDKFMDFSFEKTNSAYMLFYEWVGQGDRGSIKEQEKQDQGQSASQSVTQTVNVNRDCHNVFELSKELEDWIWCDNRTFLRDKNIFEHTYFNFMWQMCGYIPQTLLSQQPNVTETAAQLSASFFLETFIHAKEKPTMVQWVELLTKQFNSSLAAGEWFLSHMASNEWWPMQILIKCPNQMVRQMFHRLCIHVIQRLRPSQAPLYNKTDSEETEVNEELGPAPGPVDIRTIGSRSCVTRFIRMLLVLMEHGAKAHLKHLTEYFAFLYDFCKLGEEETRFLISVQAISMMVNFYMGQKAQEYGDVMSEEEEEEEVISLPPDKYKPASLEKMIALIAHLAEKSRGEDQHLRLTMADTTAVAGGKGFPFLYQQIKDNINLQYTRNLIFALCRWNDRLAMHIITMIFAAINKHSDQCQSYYKTLTLLTEVGGGPSGLPCFTQLVLQHIWEVAEHTPQSALEWLALQVPRNKLAANWVLSSLETWVEHYLIAHSNQRVRAAAASLLVALVPSPNFRQVYRAPRGIGMAHPHREVMLNAEAALVQHKIYALLLALLKQARHYTEVQAHGTAKLAAYFALLTYFAHTRTEKLMFGQYFLDLWQLFHPKLSEPAISVHHNKQALLIFWNHVSQDCPENISLILQNAHVTKNIAFNYILADHDDQDVVMFNRHMLPAYYGLLRACCHQSRAFTRQLAGHQNIQWAFKNITPYPIHYADAVDELFKLMHLFVLKYPDSTEQDLHDISLFRRQTLQLYLQSLDGRTAWSTLIPAFRTLIDSEEDRLFVVYNGGLQLMFDALYTLHMMYHEATACHVGGDLQELLSLLLECVKSVRVLRTAGAEPKDSHALLLACKDWPEALRRLATLLNTYNPPDLRNMCIDLLRELMLLAPAEALQVLVPLLSHCHTAYQDSHNACPMGPFFPRRGHKMPPSFKVNARPQRPMVQMIVPHSQLDVYKGGDENYDQAVLEFYTPYHSFIDVMCRLAINVDCMTEALVNLSAVVGYEAVPLQLTLFPKLWLDIHQTQHVDRKYGSLLIKSQYLIDYMEAVMLDERSSLNDPIIYNFLCIYFPKVASQVLNDQTCTLIESLIKSMANVAGSMNIRPIASQLNGDLRALTLAYSSALHLNPPSSLLPTLEQLLNRIRTANQEQQSTSQAQLSEPSTSHEVKCENQPEVDKAVDTPSTSSAEPAKPDKSSPEHKNSSEGEDVGPAKKVKLAVEDATADKTKSKLEKSSEVEKSAESKPEPSTSSASDSKPPNPPPSTGEIKPLTPHQVMGNWLLVLEKTVLELKEVVERKLNPSEKVSTPTTSQ